MKIKSEFWYLTVVFVLLECLKNLREYPVVDVRTQFPPSNDRFVGKLEELEIFAENFF